MENKNSIPRYMAGNPTCIEANKSQDAGTGKTEVLSNTSVNARASENGRSRSIQRFTDTSLSHINNMIVLLGQVSSNAVIKGS